MTKAIRNLKAGEIAKGTAVTITNQYNDKVIKGTIVACNDGEVKIDIQHSEGYSYTKTTGTIEWVSEVETIITNTITRTYGHKASAIHQALIDYGMKINLTCRDYDKINVWTCARGTGAVSDIAALVMRGAR